MSNFEEYLSVTHGHGVPIPVKARRVWIDEPVQTPAGPKMAIQGMWIVVYQGEHSHQEFAYTLADDLFREAFNPVTSEAEKICLENPGKGLHPVVPYKFGEEPLN